MQELRNFQSSENLRVHQVQHLTRFELPQGSGSKNNPERGEDEDSFSGDTVDDIEVNGSMESLQEQTQVTFKPKAELLDRSLYSPAQLKLIDHLIAMKRTTGGT